MGDMGIFSSKRPAPGPQSRNIWSLVEEVTQTNIFKADKKKQRGAIVYMTWESAEDIDLFLFNSIAGEFLRTVPQEQIKKTMRYLLLEKILRKVKTKNEQLAVITLIKLTCFSDPDQIEPDVPFKDVNDRVTDIFEIIYRITEDTKQPSSIDVKNLILYLEQLTRDPLITDDVDLIYRKFIKDQLTSFGVAVNQCILSVL